MPESPKWLLRQGRVDEAIELMTKIAHTNSADVDEKLIDERIRPLLSEKVDGKDENSNFLTIFSYPKVLLRCSIVWILQ